VLTTLASAVSGVLNPGVNLVDTLNGGEFTVFAPVDAAFAKIDPATIATLKVDAPLLTDILTYHVVPGQLDPSQVVGTQKTAEGATLTVTGAGDHLQVKVVSSAFAGCSRVQQHQLVYRALRQELASEAIHALALQTTTPA
jgi:uncharacterized surface protein with fasciclin (FAS1) repeats